ncbi:metallo-beta-lactamase superfamily protein [Halosimplex carlsbadense 2-9-1]|uniref:Metallo-beta-lactamase superfamily protein n=1 Tax=Halosimplex carlsbadense 2-9-1 TaxID=797114 RepID=M0CJW6_9EURY|nr:MBL fold metallo-hydrolase [Halosimplex carlsbadense]ELZ23570.1 metallo-beta-lactamase superfamily protein [Halosimplex carlsbadense 2-9-1]
MVTRLSEDAWWIELGGVNAYLVDDEGALTLVDAGMPWHGGRLLDAVVEAGFAPDDLDRVLITHYDLDHVGGLARLDGLDVTMYAGRRDAPLVAGRERPPFSIPKGAFQRLVGPLVTPPETEVVPLADGDAVGSFTAYETPGHTPGHVAYVSEALGIAILGDLVRESDGHLDPSSWIISADTDDVRRSIRDLGEAAPAFDVAAPGHGVPFERGGRDRLTDLAGRL